MKKTIGITLLLVLVCVLTAIKQPNFFAPYNAGNLARFQFRNIAPGAF